MSSTPPFSSAFPLQDKRRRLTSLPTPRKRVNDFNLQWSGDLKQLSKEVPRYDKGICGCVEKCKGSQNLVTGATFWAHQTAIARRSPSKVRLPPSRQSSLQSSPTKSSFTTPSKASGAHKPPSPTLTATPTGSPLPSPKIKALSMVMEDLTTEGNEEEEEELDIQPRSLLAALSRESIGGSQPIPAVDVFTDSGPHGGGLEDEVDDGGNLSASPASPADVPSAQEMVSADELAQRLRDAAAMLGEGDEDETAWNVEEASEAIDLDLDLDARTDISNSAVSGSLDPAHPLGARIEGPGLVDHLGDWPHPFPATLNYRSQPRPHPEQQHRRPLSVLTLAVYTIALTLTARFNATTRAVNYFLQSISILIRFVLSLGPTSRVPPFATAQTIRTSFDHLGISDTLIVHPMCPSRLCNEVYYEIETVEGFTELPYECRCCSHPLYTDGIPNALKFPRITLLQFLTKLLEQPGVESLIQSSESRRAQRDAEDDVFRQTVGSAPGYDASAEHCRIFRERADGDEYRRIQALLEERAAAYPNALTCQLDLFVDWMNLYSGMGAKSYSLGVIALQVASLPNALKHSFNLTGLLAATPGPSETKATNVWKVLLPLTMELREAFDVGLLIPTPSFPSGRRVFVALSSLGCDSPARSAVTGGPHTSNDEYCVGCHVSMSGPNEDVQLRDSHVHTAAVMKNISQIPERIEEARRVMMEDYEANELLRRESMGQRYKPLQVPTLSKAALDACVLGDGPRGALSALDVLPYMDKFKSSVFEAMHCILLGAVKTYFVRVLIFGDYGETSRPGLSRGDDGMTDAGNDSDGTASYASFDNAAAQETEALATISASFEASRKAMQASLEGDGSFVPTAEIPTLAAMKKAEKLLAKVAKQNQAARKAQKVKRTIGTKDRAVFHPLMTSIMLPSSVEKLRSDFLEKGAGTPTAHQLRVYAEFYAPLIFPHAISTVKSQLGDKRKNGGAEELLEVELKAVMLLCQIVKLLLRPAISSLQLERADRLIEEWSAYVLEVHPDLSRTYNLHFLTHITRDISNHGPVYGTWNMAAERMNKVLKTFNSNGKAGLELTLMKSWQRQGQIRQVNHRLGDLARTEDSNSLGDDRSYEEMTNALNAVTLKFARQHSAVGPTAEEALADRFEAEDQKYGERMRSFSAGYTPTADILLGLPYARSPVLSVPELECLTAFLRSARKAPGIRHIWTDAATVSGAGKGIVIQPEVERFSSLRSQGKEFRVGMTGGRVLDKPIKLRDCNDCLFELRLTRSIMASSVRSRGSVGCIVGLFSHTVKLPNGSLKPARYAQVRWLLPHSGDSFDYGGSAFPDLNLWLWKTSSFKPKFDIIELNSTTVTNMRALAARFVPLDPLDDSSETLLLTTPDTRVSTQRIQRIEKPLTSSIDDLYDSYDFDDFDDLHDLHDFDDS